MDKHRKLDKLVAEKVMGWVPGKEPDSWSAPDGSRYNIPFHPSLDIADAWEVEQHIWTMEPHVQIGYLNALCPEATDSTAGHRVNYGLLKAARQKSATEISVAALKAVGVNIAP
jgi:hypothetical protein